MVFGHVVPECADRLALKSIQIQVYKKDVPLDEAGFQQSTEEL